MKRLFHERSPSQILWMIAASNVLIAVGFAVPTAMAWHLSSNQRLPFSLKLPWLIVILVGIVGSLLGEVTFSKGVKTDRWPEESLVQPRTVLKHPAMSTLQWALLIAGLLTAIFSRTHTFGLYWIFWATCQSLARVRMNLDRRVEPSSSSGNALFPAKPLRSNQWGITSTPYLD